MKPVIFASLFLLFSITAIAQTPGASPTISPTATPTVTQANTPSPAPTTTAATFTGGIPNLPFWVEMFASAVMLVSVLSIFFLVWRHQAEKGQTINPRHIQFVSVCLIVPTILILGLEKVLTSETSATLIGGLAGYLLSGLGKYEPPRRNGGGGNTTPQPASSGSGQSPKDKVKEAESEMPAAVVANSSQQRYRNGSVRTE